MTQIRHLDWSGSWNARDLGGLPTQDGRRTRWGALVRSEHLVHVTAEGWQAIVSHGVSTLVDLRTTSESERDRQCPPTAIATELTPSSPLALQATRLVVVDSILEQAQWRADSQR